MTNSTQTPSPGDGHVSTMSTLLTAAAQAGFRVRRCTIVSIYKDRSWVQPQLVCMPMCPWAGHLVPVLAESNEGHDSKIKLYNFLTLRFIEKKKVLSYNMCWELFYLLFFIYPKNSQKNMLTEIKLFSHQILRLKSEEKKVRILMVDCFLCEKL